MPRKITNPKYLALMQSMNSQIVPHRTPSKLRAHAQYTGQRTTAPSSRAYVAYAPSTQLPHTDIDAPSQAAQGGRKREPPEEVEDEDEDEDEEEEEEEEEKEEEEEEEGTEATQSLNSAPAPAPAPAPVAPGGKKDGYTNLKELAKRMRLKPDDNLGIPQRREFVRVQCLWRNFQLDKKFENIDTKEMYRLSKSVTIDVQKQYGNSWTPDITRDIIHAICIDKVRNDRERARKALITAMKKAMEEAARAGQEEQEEISALEFHSSPELPFHSSPKLPFPAQPSSSLPEPQNRTKKTWRKRAELELMEPSDPNDKDKTLTTRKKYPRRSLMTRGHKVGPSRTMELSPLRPKNVWNDPLQALFRPVEPAVVTNDEAVTALEGVETFPVYIAGYKPIYVAIDESKCFFEAVGKVLYCPDDRFLQYKKSGSRDDWLPISVYHEFHKLMTTCRETGARVRVAPDDYFDSDKVAETSDESEHDILPPALNTHKKAKIIPAVSEKAAGKKPANGRKSKTQVITPVRMESPVLGSSTQPLPGYGDQQPDAESAVLGERVPKKRGRPPKKPVASNVSLPAHQATQTRAGRLVKLSEKLSEAATLHAEKMEAKNLAKAKRGLKASRENFTIGTN
ncbi:hypothetical protein DFP73DRAFT_615693 [Morchella snyderi]|nr:hypothetical protein DFP73DRAFT_615693 [Morchella snyderi]